MVSYSHKKQRRDVGWRTASVALLLVFVLGAVFLVLGWPKGRTNAPSANPIEVAFSFGAEDIEVYHGMQILLDRAIEESGKEIKVSYYYANTNIDLEAENIRRAIHTNPDVIVVMPQDSRVIQGSIREANTAGIPVIAYNRAPEFSRGAVPAAFVGLDTVDQAYTTALVLFRRMVSDGVPLRIINVMGNLVDRNAVNRNEGLYRAAKEVGVEIVASIETKWEPDLAYELLHASLLENPEATALFCASDWLLSGVQQALEEHDRWYPYGHPRHFFIGSQDVFTIGAQLIREGYVDVATAFDLWPMSTILVQTILAVIRGRELQQDVMLIPGRVITAGNIDSQSDLWHTHLAE
jgi:ABC-type sugar transport system substrate-binding protein